MARKPLGVDDKLNKVVAMYESARKANDPIYGQESTELLPRDGVWEDENLRGSDKTLLDILTNTPTDVSGQVVNDPNELDEPILSGPLGNMPRTKFNQDGIAAAKLRRAARAVKKAEKE